MILFLDLVKLSQILLQILFFLLPQSFFFFFSLIHLLYIFIYLLLLILNNCSLQFYQLYLLNIIVFLRLELVVLDIDLGTIHVARITRIIVHLLMLLLDRHLPRILQVVLSVLYSTSESVHDLVMRQRR